jgi:predicted pyridoxine 5'-phosphate oxidase superfamily flavin-nucleotide-binding protein
VQERAGVRRLADRVGENISPEIPRYLEGFLTEATVVVAASVGEDGWVWASLLARQPGSGLLRVPDERTVCLHAAPVPGDPLADNLRRAGAQIGLLAIDFATARRAKVKGLACQVSEDRFCVHTERAYGLCPKHVQARTVAGIEASRPGDARRGTSLTGEQRRFISLADTFFVATHHPGTGADTSHRGGFPGFVEVLDERTLAWPDYPGNRMFNTLGNLAANPNAGLLFVGFDTGQTLQLAGEARVDWAEERAARFAGAERVVEFRVREVVEIPHASPLRWRLWGYSAFNPGR